MPQHTTVARTDCVTELFHRHLDDQENGALGELNASLIAMLLLCEVARAPAVANGQSKVLIGRVESYVSSHLSESLSTSSIAKALGANPDYLNRVFRREQRMTLTEYIHRRRLRDAKQLLRERTDTIADVAATCGFADLSHFRRLFQRHTGMIPSRFRELNARAHVNVR
ncbi:MAG: AraC family transcriptional regulator [Polyangiaceae bacterium]